MRHYSDLYDEACPSFGEEHVSHWYPNQEAGGRGSTRCLGWHAFTRDITYSEARFKAPYLRGRQSNLIHRSGYEGYVIWFPDNYHQYGESNIGSWSVKVRCTALQLTNPHLLLAEQVWEQEPFLRYTPQAFIEVMLCGKCFPINEKRTSHPLRSDHGTIRTTQPLERQRRFD